MLSSISTAVGLFNESLTLAERSGLPCDQLRLNVFAWRSRCYRRQRDYEAAREDVERALELAEAMHDARALGQAYFQASMLAERDGHWVLARTYAEKAKTQYEELADRANVGRLLNNLGGIEFLLGKPEQAVEHLKHAFAVALEIGRNEEAATAISSLAQVHLRTGDVEARGRAGDPRARADRRSRRHARRGRQRPPRARSRPAAAGAARRGRDRRSATPKMHFPSCRPRRIVRPRGSPRVTWRPGAATSVARRFCTARRQKRSRTSGSKGRRCSLWQSSLFSSTAVARWCSYSPSSLLSSARSSVIRIRTASPASVSGTAPSRAMTARFARFFSWGAGSALLSRAGASCACASARADRAAPVGL